jgi:hypothetical protein
MRSSTNEGVPLRLAAGGGRDAIRNPTDSDRAAASTDAKGGCAQEQKSASRLMKNSIRAADDPDGPSAASPRLAVFGEYGSAASPSFI